MLCSNFVCVFSSIQHDKVLCDYDGLTDCDINRQMSCKRFKRHDCKWCAHEIRCFRQREKGVFYSADKGNFVPAISSAFAEKALQNDLTNAKRDIYETACRNYKQGYKTSTTVKQLYEKYRKQFPQFTKEFLNEAVYKSILKYLQAL
ncbi:MAG: hypothetical protein NC253_01475 [Ruminococcus sp.]|nr:hypothetical protein [Ruminococcus sp.]MCM1381165.1 hypothetical protein [Muribaculaceae bacterium]MCM1479656.1 hypothetical protein [Muribaculaceae bacterium]